MYTANRMVTDSLGVGEETDVWAKWQMPTHQPLCVSENWRVGKMHDAYTTSLNHLPHGSARSRVTVITCPRSCHGPDPLQCLFNCRCHVVEL